MKRSKAELRRVAYSIAWSIVQNALNEGQVNAYCVDKEVAKEDEEYIYQVIAEIVSRLEKKA